MVGLRCYAGLVNGILGWVRDIVWPEGANPRGNRRKPYFKGDEASRHVAADISGQDFQPGPTYVANFWVSLSLGVMLEVLFDLEAVC